MFLKKKRKLLIAILLLHVPFLHQYHVQVNLWSWLYFCLFLSYLARKSEIIRSTELLLDAISSNDFESYAYVDIVYNSFLTFVVHSYIVFYNLNIFVFESTLFETIHLLVEMLKQFLNFFTGDSVTQLWLHSSQRPLAI